MEVTLYPEIFCYILCRSIILYRFSIEVAQEDIDQNGKCGLLVNWGRETAKAWPSGLI